MVYFNIQRTVQYSNATAGEDEVVGWNRLTLSPAIRSAKTSHPCFSAQISFVSNFLHFLQSRLMVSAELSPQRRREEQVLTFHNSKLHICTKISELYNSWKEQFKRSLSAEYTVRTFGRRLAIKVGDDCHQKMIINRRWGSILNYFGSYRCSIRSGGTICNLLTWQDTWPSENVFS